MAAPQNASEGLALLFDIDGVIVDSNPVHVAVWRDYLKPYGIDPGEGLPGRMYGRRNDDIVRDFFGAGLSPEEILARGAEKEALYREVMRRQLQGRLVPGVASFLQSHRKMAMAVATNAEPANAEFILKEAGIWSLFTVVVDGHQVEQPKPAPDIYLLTADLLGVPPRNCIVFEDSTAGVEAAHAAGTRIVALTTTQTDFPFVDLMIPNFLGPEVEAWLGRQAVRP